MIPDHLTHTERHPTKRHPVTMGAAIKILSEPPWELYRRMNDDYKAALRMAIKALTADKLNIEHGP